MRLIDEYITKAELKESVESLIVRHSSGPEISARGTSRYTDLLYVTIRHPLAITSLEREASQTQVFVDDEFFEKKRNHTPFSSSLGTSETVVPIAMTTSGGCKASERSYPAKVSENISEGFEIRR